MSTSEAFEVLSDLLVDAPESIRNATSRPVNNLDKQLMEWELL